MSITLNKNIDLLETHHLSTNDVLIKPTTGLLATRKHAQVKSTFIYNSPMDTVASFDLFDNLLDTNQAAVSCRFNTEEARMHELALYKNKPNYWFTVGASNKDFRMLNEYCSRHPKASLNICVDVAHGNTVQLHKLYKKYSESLWCNSLMSGTVATPESAYEVWNAGCTHIRIGIGPGSACSTRIVTGCGVPNLSAVFQVWLTFREQQLEEYPVLIADGGIKTSGDIAKYLSAGADAVMIGNLLSKTKESAGWQKNKLFTLLNILTFNFCFKNKCFYKRYRGQASAQFKIDKSGFVSGTQEGVQGPKKYPDYKYLEFYNKIVNALRSTISYVGVKDIRELTPDNVEFIRITPSGLQESKPHLLD